MSEKTKKNDGIKDSISKLFILKDSCTGTCITQKDAPNIIWFEGAALLLKQGLDKLKSAKQKIDSDSEGASKDFYSYVNDTVSKLIVLKNSCRGVSRLKETDENINWFEGAESIICEVIDQLQKELQIQEATPKTPDTSSSKESTSTAAAAEPKSTTEESETDKDADEAEKQAAAG
jgi:hypothetical protein